MNPKTDQQLEEDLEQLFGTASVRDDFVQQLRKQLVAQPVTRCAARQFSKPSRLVWGFAALLVLVLLVVWLVGPQKVTAAVQKWLGFVPGVGIVQTISQPLALPEPVQQIRDGISLIVQQVAADSDHTVVIFEVEGLTFGMRPTDEAARGCPSGPYLLLPDGVIHQVVGGDGDGWGGGYRSRLVFAALPQDVTRLEFVVPCLEDTLPGMAPEDWRFTLMLQPLTSAITPLPVQEFSQTVAPTGTIVLQTQDAQRGISLQILQVVEMESGWMIQGEVNWQSTVYNEVYLDQYQFQLTDASGQSIVYEPQELDFDYDVYAERRQDWALLTAGKDFTGPLTLTLGQINVRENIEVPFTLDLGDDFEIGESREVDISFVIPGHSLRINQMRLEQYGPYNCLYLYFTGDPNLVYANWAEREFQPGNETGGGGMADGDHLAFEGKYYTEMPRGKRDLLLTGLITTLNESWQISWMPEVMNTFSATSPTVAAPACLTDAAWQQAPGPDGGAFTPDGLLLQQVPANGGENYPSLRLMTLDGNIIREIDQASEGSLFPGGRRLVYTSANGLHLLDLQTDLEERLAWSVPGDSHAKWSPDGSQMVFYRGGDAAGLYVVRVDGSAMQRLAKIPEWVYEVGWSPDSLALLYGYDTPSGMTLFRYGLTGGDAKELFVVQDTINTLHVSPDGLWVAYQQKVFGSPSYAVYAVSLETGETRLLAFMETEQVSIGHWSPNSRWILLYVMRWTDGQGYPRLVLVDLETCQLVRLPGEGYIAGWFTK
jgi:hypothetical protein